MSISHFQVAIRGLDESSDGRLQRNLGIKEACEGGTGGTRRRQVSETGDWGDGSRRFR